MKKPVRILIVEDKPDDADLAKYEIRKILRDCDFQVAETRESFAEALETFQPDLILSDYTLPHFDGLKALQLTVQRAPLTPFIIWTGSISEDVAVDCVKAGANNYILKDNLKRLGPAILRALEERELLVARQHAEEEVKERQRQLSILFSNLPGPVYRCRNDANFTMEFISNGIEELSGYHPDDFRKHRRHFGKMIHPDDQERVWNEIQTAVDHTKPFELTYRIITASGEEKWVWEKGQGIWNEQGELESLEGFITDITVRRHAEQKYQSIFENSMEGIFQSSPQGHYLSVNPRMARLYGYASPKEMIDSIRDIATQIYVEPKKRSEFIGLLNSQGSLENFEAKNYRKDGSIIWTSTSARTVRDLNGNVLYYEGFIQDITQRKRIEEALLNNESRFRALLENGLDDISLLAADGTLLWESPSTIRNLGYAPNEFVGRNIFELMHPEDRAWTGETYAKLIKEPGTRQRGVFRLRRTDGAWRWVEAIATNMLREPSVNAIVINYRDITEQKQAEIELQQKNADLTLVNALNESINRGEDLDAVMNLLRQELKRIFATEYTNIYLLNPDGQSIRLHQYTMPPEIAGKIENVIGRALPKIEIPVQEDGLFQSVLRSGRGMVTSNREVLQKWVGEFVETASLPPFAKAAIRRLLPQIYNVLNIKSTVLVPLISDGKALGVMNVSGAVVLTEQDLSRIENICGQLTIALHRKLIEEALLESQTRYQTLVETSHDLIWSADPEGRITFLNRAAKEVYGYEPEELIGRSFFELLDPEYYQPEEIGRLRNTLTQATESNGVESYVRHRDGRQIILSSNSIVLRDEYGNVTGIAGSSHDITVRKQVEDVLKEERNLLRTLIDNLPDRIYAMDMHGRKTLSNTADWQASGGKTMEDAIGKTDFDLYPLELATGFWKLDKDVLDSGKPVINYEEPGLDANGNRVSILTTKIPLRDDEGHVIGLVGIGRDITERKQTEERLRYSENRYRLVTQATNDIIWEWNPETHQLSWSENAQHVFGYSSKEIGPDEKWWDNHIHPEDRERVLRALNALIEGTDCIWTEEYRFLLKNGSYAYISDRAYIERDASGAALRMIGAMANITERKQAEETLRQSQSRYRALVETQTDFIVRWQPDGKRTFANEAYCKYFGFTPENALDEHFSSLIYKEDRKSVEEKIQRLTSGATNVEIDVHRVIKPDGSIGWQEWTDQAIRDNHGRLIEFQSVGRDITERKQAETERQVLLEIMQGLANTRDVQELLELVHRSIAKVIYAENFFVVLHHESSGLFEEIYSVDQYDPPAPPSKLENSITSYVFHSGQPLLLTQASFDELSAQGRVKLVGTNSASWLGVPLKTSGKTIGVIAVQDYENDNRYSDREKDLLSSIAVQVALVIERKRAEEALRESEERFSGAFEYASIGMALVAPNGSLLRVNWAMCCLLGYSEVELLQKTFQDLTHPEDLPNDLNGVHKLLAGDIDSFQMEKRYFHKQGHVVWALLNLSLVRNNQGRPQYFISQIQDITERKKVETALVESNTRFRTLFEASPDAIILVDPTGDWPIIDCNTAACQMNGYNREEMIGHSIDLLNAVPSEAEKRGEYLKSIRQAGVLHFETLHKRRDGTVFTVDISTSIIRVGNRDIVLGIDRDVTERKRVENQLRFEKERFDSIAAAVPGIICSLRMRPDGSTCMPFASPAIQDVYGLLPQDIQHDAAPLFARIHTDDLPTLLIAINESAQDMSPWHSEFRYRHPAKGEVWIEGQAVPSKEPDGSVIWHGFIYDVTERKRAEEEIRRSAKETSALLETSLALTHLDLEDTLQTIGNSANTLFLADGCRIFLMDHDSETLRCVLALGENMDAFSELRIRVGEGVTGAVAASGRPEIVNEMHNDPRAVQVLGTDEEKEAIMFAPLTEQGRTIGIISIRRVGENLPFQPADLDLLEAFASMAASAVSKARLFDETQRRLDELHASEERFRQLADNIEEAFWMTDAETGKEVYMSPAVETIWARPIQSLMYEPDAYINSVLPEDRPILLDAMEREKRGEKIQMEYRIVRPDGSLRWIWARAFPIPDESGRVRRIAGISADITERKQNEQELRKLYHAVEQSGSSVVITDTHGIIEYVNPKFTKTTGYSYEEVIGQNPRVLKSGLTSQDEYKELWQTINNGHEWHGELLNKKKDGELFWESVTISPILNDRREITHFVGVKEDITERKHSEIEIRRHVAELEAVYENGLSVGRLLEPGEIGNRVIETFARHLPWHHVTIRLRKEEGDDLELVSFSLPSLKEEERSKGEEHFVGRISKVEQGLSGWVIQTGMSLRTGDVHAYPQYIDTHTGIQSGLYMPLKVGERVIGVISVESEAPDAFTEQDERLLATLANQTAIAFENARLYEAMQKELAERKRVEDALRISETHYRALADSITDILFELDQNLHYTHWNKASETLLGVSAQDVIGKSMEEILGKSEEQARIKTIYEDVLKSQQSKTFEATLLIGREKRSFEVNAYPSMRGVSVVAKDVTERKRTETIMQKRFELMEFSAKHSLHELMRKTLDEVIQLTGSAVGFFHLVEADQLSLGMQTWSTSGMQLFEAPPQAGSLLPVNWEAVRQRRPLIQNDHQSSVQKEGMPFDRALIVREMVIPIIRNERIMAIMGVGNKPQDYTSDDLGIAARLADYAWDITERKQMEVALEAERNQLVQRVEERTADLSRANSNLARALRVKDEFLANMSHELRTPLNAILGLSESLGEQIAGPLNEKQQKYISTISESGHHLLSLINDILDLAKIDAGQITLDINKVDIHSVCQASLRMIKQLAQKKNQEVSLKIDHGLGLMWADERRLKQMIVNLLGNAVKFTPENGELGLEVCGNEEANQVSITVWDNGIGIRQEDLARLFQPFVQLDSGLAREATGTGLGLALVAQMARLHGGSVNAVSETGKGSRFTIILPWEPALAMDNASRMRITGKFRAIPLDDKNRPTILLVEDTKEVVMMLKDYLELAGYKIYTAQDGVDGLVQARHVKPDLILMDVQMPRMDGFETTRKLRSDPNFRYTPIIGLTALAMPHDRERCLQAGMDEYISKPVNLKALIKIIQNCLFEQESRTR